MADKTVSMGATGYTPQVFKDNGDGTWCLQVAASGGLGSPSDAAAAAGVPGASTLLWNGATFDRQRSGSQSNVASAIGFANTIPIAVANAVAPALTEGQFSQSSIDLNNNLRVVSLTEGQKSTYSAAIAGVVASALVTDLLTIIGSASKTVRVVRLSMTATATAATVQSVQIIKRSAADTGGTPTTATAVSHDTNSAAAGAVVKTYAGVATVGAAVGPMRSVRYLLGTASVPAVTVVWTFGTENDQTVVLRGVAQTLAIFLPGAPTIVGNAFDFDITWTEE